MIGNGPDNNDYSFNVSEYQAPVANLTLVEKNGITLESYFVSGDAYSTSIRADNVWDTVYTTEPVEDQTIVVTVVGEAGNRKYYFDGVETPNLTLKSGATYTFDLSDPSLEGHPLRFSETPDGTHGGGPQYGTEWSGEPGSEGAYIKLNVEDWSPDTLYYYCEQHSGMGGSGSSPQ